MRKMQLNRMRPRSRMPSNHAPCRPSRPPTLRFHTRSFPAQARRPATMAQMKPAHETKVELAPASVGSSHGTHRLRRVIVGTAITRHSLQGEAAARADQTALRRQQVAQHVLQDAAVAEVVELVQRIDTADERDAPQPAVGGDDLRHQALVRLELALQTPDGDLLAALEAERLPRGAFLETERQHAHADQVGTVDALERLGDDG